MFSICSELQIGTATKSKNIRLTTMQKDTTLVCLFVLAKIFRTSGNGLIN